MKTMTCSQLGGACEQTFSASTFEEIGDLSKAHAMEMMQKQDGPHLEAMQKMGELMQDPAAMQAWFAERQAAFDALPED